MNTEKEWCVGEYYLPIEFLHAIEDGVNKLDQCVLNTLNTTRNSLKYVIFFACREYLIQGPEQKKFPTPEEIVKIIPQISNDTRDSMYRLGLGQISLLEGLYICLIKKYLSQLQ